MFLLAFQLLKLTSFGVAEQHPFNHARFCAGPREFLGALPLSPPTFHEERRAMRAGGEKVRGFDKKNRRGCRNAKNPDSERERAWLLTYFQCYLV